MPVRPDPMDVAVQHWLHASLCRDFAAVLDEPVPAELASLLRELVPEG